VGAALILSMVITARLTAEAHREGTLPTGKTPISNYSSLKETADTATNREKEMMIFDFAKTDDQTQWRPINDTVMGGISDSTLQSTKEGKALFSGIVSLENNGGFASLQSQPASYNLAGYQGIALRVKGDGKRYKFSLKTNEYPDSTRYEAVFNTDKGKWITVNIPFTTLVPTFRGTILNNDLPIDISKVKSFGLLISDKQEGPFRLEIEWIKAYR